MTSAPADTDNIDKLYKNYDILNDAKDKITEVRNMELIHVFNVFVYSCVG